MGRTGTTRRRALIVTGAAATGALAPTGLLTGCSPGDGRRGTRSSAAEREEARLRRRSVATSAALLERYDAVLAAHPSLGPRLYPLRAAVASHTAALGAPDTGPGAGTATPPGTAAGAPAAPTAAPAPAASAAGTAAPTARPSGSPEPVPQDPGGALARLAADARRTAEAHTAALLAAPPEYARLLASVAAAAAAHAYLLTADQGGA
ncbi:hypothetical protein [Streptomyces sp. NPDC006368]|uniref:hypothetical protein n=1 Tax=Streptomyces sp. NPDC006368 TaxID=3156760 RepID=UPI0033AF82FF